MTKRLISTVLALSLLFMVVPVVSEAILPYGEKVASLAQELIGTPYVLGGTSTAGFDASGLLVYVYGAYGVDLPRTISEQFNVGTPITRSNLKPGDIVLFSAGGARWTSIFTGNDEVIWASSSLGKVRKASLKESAVLRNAVGARRLPDSAFAPLGQLMAQESLKLIGAPYQFGASGPSSFDSSGLMQHVHDQFGVSIPRTMSAQYSGGQSILMEHVEQGDLVFFGRESVELVGLFVGNGEFVYASKTLGKVAKRNMAAFSLDFMGARRYSDHASSAPPTVPLPPAPILWPDLASEIIARAEQYLGAPYVFGASGPDTFDCSGFTRYIFAQHNIYLPRTSVSQSQAGTLVARSDMKKGDLLIFVDTYKPGISHVGIYIEGDKFLHTIPRTGVSYGILSQAYWNSRLHSVRRVIK